MADSTSAAQKTTRAKRTTKSQTDEGSKTQPSAPGQPVIIPSTLNELISQINQIQAEFENIQKEISQTKEKWVKEQNEHEAELVQRKTQEEQNRKIEQEIYEYELLRNRKRGQDEFTDQKLDWQKELLSRKEEIEKDKRELVELRKSVEDFDRQTSQAAQSAQNQLREELTQKFETDKKLTDQQFKSEKEILILKIENLAAQNSQQTAEIKSLKESLDDATRQLKEIAVRVIDASSPQAKISHQTEDSIS